MWLFLDFLRGQKSKISWTSIDGPFFHNSSYGILQGLKKCEISIFKVISLTGAILINREADREVIYFVKKGPSFVGLAVIHLNKNKVNTLASLNPQDLKLVS